MSAAERLLLLISGLAGALGVTFSAMAAHGDYADTLKTCSEILLAHAPALLAAVALMSNKQAPRRMVFFGGFLIFVGLCLFCGDLVRRTFVDLRLFPMAAPAGGVSMIAGWIFIAIAALLPRIR
ncbi:MAG: DUF423 domain-containing protein [Burkholderiales bacterium]|jgi:uncharacterized membrane protein YgdD (TMEM256/DUF423 family)|nr:DUF423 domain-containing protein [Burkholderiales bacterium]